MAAAARQQAVTTYGSTPGLLTGSRSGIAYKLGQEIGQGGNGIVYAVARQPELVAKIQKYPLSQHEVDKLDALVRAATPELLAVAAWPMDGLVDASGHTVGFVMPRILDARPLYELYSPRSRVQHFPSADFRFIVHAAANVARLFTAVHKAGFICGDVNHSNILVRETATVAAVDCDSFQVGDGARFPCLVGTDLFVPPELTGIDLGQTRRTENHDNFGLALLVFHLLFMGRHPFAGRFTGRGEMTIERAIAESRYAYSRDTRRTELLPPPHTLPLSAIGADIAVLFERAFFPAATKGGRPAPAAWVDALEALKASLAPCHTVPHHFHPPTVKNCPWCELEDRARIKLFGGIVKVTTAKVADLETIWARYLALAEPGPPRALPPLPKRRARQPICLTRPCLPGFGGSLARLAGWVKAWAAALPGGLRSLPERIRYDNILLAGSLVLVIALDPNFRKPLLGLVTPLLASGVALIDIGTELIASPHEAALASVLFAVGGPFAATIVAPVARAIVAVFLRPSSAQRGRAPKPLPFPLPARSWRPNLSRLTARRTAKQAYRTAAARWQNQPSPPDVSALKPAIAALKVDLDALTAKREAEVCTIAVPEPPAAQLARHLAGLRIEDAKLSGIGTARCAVLRSWGIDTAADIDEAKISEIPGFGKSLTDKLAIWRDLKANAFTPSTAAFVDPIKVQAIDRRLAQRRTRLMKDLREKIAEVERIMVPYLEARNNLWTDVESARAAVMA